MKRPSHAFSVPELMVVSTLFAVFLLVSYNLVSSGMLVWQKTASSQDAMYQLAKVREAMQSELNEASFDSLLTTKSPTNTPNDLLWFRSAIDLESEAFVRKDDGTPFWQRNILYYTAVPNGHDEMFDVKCAGEDTRCPHKFLIKRVIDHGYATGPTSPVSLEEPIMTAKTALTWADSPPGFSLDFGKPYSDFESLIATGIVTFNVELRPGKWDDEVQVTISAFNVEEATKKMALGRVPLERSPYTHYYRFTAYPGNQ